MKNATKDKPYLVETIKGQPGRGVGNGTFFRGKILRNTSGLLMKEDSPFRMGFMLKNEPTD